MSRLYGVVICASCLLIDFDANLLDSDSSLVSMSVSMLVSTLVSTLVRV